MSLELLHANAAVLKSRFEVTGRFYSSLGGHLCRDELNIRQTGTAATAAVDAVFIMMNPGSSAPLVGEDTAKIEHAVHVPARPDTTQYQLMRLMGFYDWRFVRVLNLSDLRTPKSGELQGVIDAYERDEGHDGHSIFSPRRASDLQHALRRRTASLVVVAWGVGARLRPLAARALEALSSSGVAGLAKVPGGWAYRHPLPQTHAGQIAWRTEMVSVLGPAESQATI